MCFMSALTQLCVGLFAIIIALPVVLPVVLSKLLLLPVLPLLPVVLPVVLPVLLLQYSGIQNAGRIHGEMQNKSSLLMYVYYRLTQLLAAVSVRMN